MTEVPAMTMKTLMSLDESVHEILASPKQRLGDMFYQHLLERHPELRPFFEKLDLRVQATMLMNALWLVAAHARHRHAATSEYLKILGYRHHQHRVPTDAFPKFIQTFLAVLADFHGPAWNEPLAMAWQSALEHACADMLAGYREHALTY